MFKKLDIHNLIALAFIVLAFLFLYFLLFVHVPKDNESIINIVSGILLASLGTIINYYFGNSKKQADQPNTTTITTEQTTQN